MRPPYSSQAEPANVLRAETGISAHPDTFAKALKQTGITRVKQRAKGSFQAPEPRKSYGYNETHRRQLPEQRYPSCLTDAEVVTVGRETPVSRAISSRVSPCAASRTMRVLRPSRWGMAAANAPVQFGFFCEAKRNVQCAHLKLSEGEMTPEV